MVLSKTQPTNRLDIGVCRASAPESRAGLTRVDSLHQGDHHDTQRSGNVLKQLIVNGQVVSTYGKGTDPDKQLDDDGNPRFIQQGDYGLTFQAINNKVSPGSSYSVTVGQGDTLAGLAQQHWGNASLWWKIAEANPQLGSVGPSGELKAGLKLNMASQVGGLNNTADTNRPYDPSQIIGDTTPFLPAPPQDDGCGVLGMIIMIIVAVVVTYITAGAAAPYMAGFFGTSAAGVAAATVATAAVAAAAGSIASQLVGMAMGNVKDFSWKAVGQAALMGGVTAGIGIGMESLAGSESALAGIAKAYTSASPAVQVAVKTAMATAVIGAAKGEFSWRAVVAAGVTSYAGQSLGNALGGSLGNAWSTGASTESGGIDWGQQAGSILGQTLGKTAGSLLGSMVANDSSHLNGRQVRGALAQSFGNSLGDAITGEMAGHKNFEREMAKQEAIDDAVAQGRPFKLDKQGQVSFLDGDPNGMDLQSDQAAAQRERSDRLYGLASGGGRLKLGASTGLGSFERQAQQTFSDMVDESLRSTAEATPALSDRALLNLTEQLAAPGRYTSIQGQGVEVRKGDTTGSMAKQRYGDRWVAGLGLMAQANQLEINQWHSPIVREGSKVYLPDLDQFSAETLAEAEKLGQALLANNDKGLSNKRALEQRFAEQQRLQAERAAEAQDLQNRKEAGAIYMAYGGRAGSGALTADANTNPTGGFAGRNQALAEAEQSLNQYYEGQRDGSFMGDLKARGGQLFGGTGYSIAKGANALGSLFTDSEFRAQVGEVVAKVVDNPSIVKDAIKKELNEFKALPWEEQLTTGGKVLLETLASAGMGKLATTTARRGVDLMGTELKALGEALSTGKSAAPRLSEAAAKVDLPSVGTVGDEAFQQVYKLAPAAKLEVDELASVIAKKYDADLATAPVKSAERAWQKVVNDYDGDASRIKDLARNTIIASEADIPRIVDDLAAAGAKVKVINAADDALGYSGINASIKTKAGIHAEIQVNTPAMIFAKESPEIAERLLGAARYAEIAKQVDVPGGLGHKLYEQHRVLDKASDAARAIASQSRQYYDSVRGGVGKSTSPSLLQRSEVTAPNGRAISVVRQDGVVVPVDKVEVYARGGSPNPSMELSALQAFKQQNRKAFDLDPGNQARIDRLKNMQHNFERSQAMAKNLDTIGLANTVENNDIILRNLLETGQSVTPTNRVWVPGTLAGPNGVLRVNSTWAILPDGTNYLSTLRFMPIGD